MMTLKFTLSIFHSCQVTYQLALHMVLTSNSSLDMQDAAHPRLFFFHSNAQQTVQLSVNAFYPSHRK